MNSFYASRYHGCRVDEFGWRGHRLIVLENERLRVSVLASKGADILELRYKTRDLDVLWHAPQTVLPPGQGIPTTARSQGSFLDYFSGGWQEVLPNAGPASVFGNTELGQHGEVALLPWDVRVLEDSEARVELEFSVETRRTPFRLIRRMSLQRGSARMILDEELLNLGEEELPYQWGHHPSFGPPFLEAGCVLELPPCSVTEPEYAKPLRRRFAINQSGTFPHLETIHSEPGRVDAVLPKESRTEDVLLFSGFREGVCNLQNPNQQLQVCLRWDATVFPYLWCWQAYGGSYGYPYYGRLYTLAIEPFNSPIEPLSEVVKGGIARMLGPGESIDSHLEIEISAA